VTRAGGVYFPRPVTINIRRDVIRGGSGACRSSSAFVCTITARRVSTITTDLRTLFRKFEKSNDARGNGGIVGIAELTAVCLRSLFVYVQESSPSVRNDKDNRKTYAHSLEHTFFTHTHIYIIVVDVDISAAVDSLTKRIRVRLRGRKSPNALRTRTYRDNHFACVHATRPSVP